mgnify:CR=1 FL=1
MRDLNFLSKGDCSQIATKILRQPREREHVFHTTEKGKYFLPSSTVGKGKSLRTCSMSFELSWLTMRATRPSKISPCTFMWSIDPAASERERAKF